MSSTSLQQELQAAKRSGMEQAVALRQQLAEAQAVALRQQLAEAQAAAATATLKREVDMRKWREQRLRTGADASERQQQVQLELEAAPRRVCC